MMTIVDDNSGFCLARYASCDLIGLYCVDKSSEAAYAGHVNVSRRRMCTYVNIFNVLSIYLRRRGELLSGTLANPENERPPRDFGWFRYRGVRRGNNRPRYVGISLNHPKTRCRYPVEEIRLRGLPTDRLGVSAPRFALVLPLVPDPTATVCLRAGGSAVVCPIRAIARDQSKVSSAIEKLAWACGLFISIPQGYDLQLA
jgi:hypothetical protein